MQVTFEQSAAGFVLEAFSDLERKCESCGAEITVDNLAGVIGTESGPVMICNHVCCLFTLADNLRKTTRSMEK